MGKKSRSGREPRKPKQIKPPKDSANTLADIVRARAKPPVGAAK